VSLSPDPTPPGLATPEPAAGDAAAQAALQVALSRAVSDYFDGCRDRIDPFVARHFRYPGAWRTNRRALGWDLLRAPANLLWAPFYLLCLLLASLSTLLGCYRLGALLRRAPDGLTTEVQCHIAGLIQSELLSRPGRADAPGRNEPTAGPALEPVIAAALAQYGLTRTASADIANSLLSTALGVFAFQKFTPGGIAVGMLLASWLAREQAVGSFFLGEFFGRIYYTLLPAEPSAGMTLLGIALAACALSVFASLSGLLTDPLQARTGLHRRRLQRMIDHLQRDFEAGSGSTFSPRDPWVARILDLLDVAKSHVM
jgi:hypothetical protein